MNRVNIKNNATCINKYDVYINQETKSSISAR